MKKRKSPNHTKHLHKKQDKSWKMALFFALFTLAVVAFFASRQSYLMGQTLGCTAYDVCPTTTTTTTITTTISTTPKPSAGGGGGTVTTVTPITTTTAAPSQAATDTTTPNPSTSPSNTSNIPDPANNPSSLSNPESIDTPAIPSPRSFRSLISDPETGSVTSQSLIAAPAAITAALYNVAYDNIASQINAFTNSVTHSESSRLNRFRLPAQVCTFLGNVGMEWLCQ